MCGNPRVLLALAPVAAGLLGMLLPPAGVLPALGGHAPSLAPWRALDRAPDLAIPHDHWGLALKEAPFLLPITLAALPQLDAPRALRATAALGYGPMRAWALVALFRLLPLLRLPLAAVLAFSLSVGDVALLLGPTQPPTLAVPVLRDLLSPDLARWFPGAAGAALLLALVLAALAMGRLAEAALLAGLRRVAASGVRGGEARVARRLVPLLPGVPFQDELLPLRLSVAANLAFGLRPGGDRAAALSGGQRARRTPAHAARRARGAAAGRALRQARRRAARPHARLHLRPRPGLGPADPARDA